MSDPSGGAAAAATSAPPPPASLPGLFRTRGYLLLWLAAAVLAAGQALTLDSLHNFWAVDPLSYDGQVATLISLAGGLGLAGGYLSAALWADHRSKRRLFLTAALMLGAIAVCTAIVNLTAAPPEIRIPIAALLGLAYGLAIALLLGWLGDLLPRRLLARGVVVWSVSAFPFVFLTIALYRVLPHSEERPIWLFALGAGLSLCAAFLARRVPGGDPPTAMLSAPLEGLASAVRAVRRDLRLRTLLIYAAIAGGAVALANLLLTHYRFVELYIRSGSLDGGGELSIAESYSLLILLTFVEVGVLLILIHNRRRWPRFIAAAAALGAVTIALSLAAPHLRLQGLACFLTFSAYGTVGSIVIAAVQALTLQSTPAGSFGRLAGVLLFAGYAPALAAQQLDAPLADWLSAR